MKKTTVYLNGRNIKVTNEGNLERYCIYYGCGNNAILVCEGSTLKSCVNAFRNSRTNEGYDESNLLEYFVDQEYGKEKWDNEEAISDETWEQFSNWTNNLEPEKLFDMLKDGTYHDIVDWGKCKEYKEILELYTTSTTYVIDEHTVKHTLTVGELIEILEQYNEDTPIVFNNDNGYSYGRLEEENIRLKEEEVEN